MTFTHPKGTLKKAAIVITALSVIGALMFYLQWAAGIARQTILMPYIPAWTTYIAVSILFGLIFAGRALCRLPVEITLKRIASAFSSGLCIGFVCVLNSYDVGAYLLPGETVEYDSTYEITYPGPALGRTSRCEAGLWIEDPNTGRRLQLCTNKADLDRQIQRGMTAVRVTARTNRIGSYIIGHQFIYQYPESTLDDDHSVYASPSTASDDAVDTARHLP